MRLIALFLCIFFTSLAVASDGFPDSLDVFFDSGGITGHFVDTHDPGYIVIELESGEIIDATYSGIDSHTLWDWEKMDKKNGAKRSMLIKYSIADGVMVKDIKTGKTFNLIGVIESHPIDWASSQCKKSGYGSTIELKHCQGLELEAWDAELNRAYQALGGSKNLKLKHSQQAWIKFRDAQNDYFHSEYGRRDGTIWGLVSMDHVISVTRDQAEQLQSVIDW